MGLHLGMKLEYFHNQKWKEEWIEEAESLVREAYVAGYENMACGSNTTPMKTSKINDNGGFTSFGNLSITSASCASEIQAYLKHPVKNVKDPMKWWVDNQHVYLNLHHMALNYLSIPGKCSLQRVNDSLLILCFLFIYFYRC